MVTKKSKAAKQESFDNQGSAADQKPTSRRKKSKASSSSRPAKAAKKKQVPKSNRKAISKQKAPIKKKSAKKPPVKSAKPKTASRKKADKPVAQTDWGLVENCIKLNKQQAAAAEAAKCDFNQLFAEKLPQSIVNIQSEENERFAELLRQRQSAEEVLARHRSRIVTEIPELSAVLIDYRRDSAGQVTFPLEICICIQLRPGMFHERFAAWVDIEGVPVYFDEREYGLIEELAPPARRLQEHHKPRARLSKGRRPMRKESPQPMREVTPPTVAPKVDSIPSETFDPICGGIPISNSGCPTNWGTLGIPVVQGDRIGFLTCQHVAVPIGQPISTIGVIDIVVQPPSSGEVSIGNVDLHNKQRDRFLDAAVITSNSTRKWVKQLVWGNSTLGVSIGEGIAQTGQRVFQIGAASRKNIGFGRVKDTNATINVGNTVEMNGQILVEPEDPTRPIIRKGDSGAVLLHRVNKDRVEVIGLVHAMTDAGEIVACKWDKIKQRFGVKLP